MPSGAATQVVLENGVVVSFSIAAGGSGRFRPGDYWIFAARTADTSVEELDAAPPLGIHHHYARLGFVTFPGSQTDCRRLWPPLGGDGRRLRLHGLRDARGTRPARSHPGRGRPGEGDGRTDLPRAPASTTSATASNVTGARSLRIRGQGPATILVARGTALTIQQSIARHGRELRGRQRLRGARGDPGAQRRRRDAAGPRRPVVRRGETAAARAGRALGRRRCSSRSAATSSSGGRGVDAGFGEQHRRLRRGAARRGQRRRRAAARDRPRRPLRLPLLVPRRAQRHPRRETAAASRDGRSSRPAGRST